MDRLEQWQVGRAARPAVSSFIKSIHVRLLMRAMFAYPGKKLANGKYEGELQNGKANGLGATPIFFCLPKQKNSQTPNSLANRHPAPTHCLTNPTGTGLSPWGDGERVDPLVGPVATGVAGSARSGCGCRLKLALLTPPIETSHLTPRPCISHSSSPSPNIPPAVGHVVREKSIHGQLEHRVVVEQMRQSRREREYTRQGEGV